MRESSAKGSGLGSTGFVRKDLLTRRWYNVDDKIARDKCSQALRDLIKSKRGVVTKKRSSNLLSHEDAQSDSEDDSSLGSKRLRRDRMWSSNPVMNASNVDVAAPLGYSSYCRSQSLLGRPFSPASPQERLFTSATHRFLPEAHLSPMDATIHPTQILSNGGYKQININPPMLVATFQNQLSAELEPTPISDNLHRCTIPPMIQREDSTVDLLRHMVPRSDISDASVPQRAILVHKNGSYPDLADGTSLAANLPHSSRSTALWHEPGMLPTVIGTDNFFRFTGRPIDDAHQPQDYSIPNITKSSSDVEGGHKPAATTGKVHK